jgi:hypothetical protein
MADVTIGGQVWSVTLPNFKALKAAWRYIAAVQASSDPMASVEAILGIVSVGSASAVTVDELEEALTPAEMPGLRTFINDLMIEIGLATPEAAANDPLAGEGTARPSTATSTTSSAPSSPASVPATGTASSSPGTCNATPR